MLRRGREFSAKVLGPAPRRGKLPGMRTGSAEEAPANRKTETANSGKAVRTPVCRLAARPARLPLGSGFLKEGSRHARTPGSRPHTSQVSRAILPRTGTSHKRPAHRGRLQEGIRHTHP